MGERLRRLPNLETTLDRILVGLSNLKEQYVCVCLWRGGGSGGGGQYSEPPETFITTIMTTTNLFPSAIPPYEHVKSRIKSSS